MASQQAGRGAWLRAGRQRNVSRPYVRSTIRPLGSRANSLCAVGALDGFRCRCRAGRCARRGAGGSGRPRDCADRGVDGGYLAGQVGAGDKALDARGRDRHREPECESAASPCSACGPRSRSSPYPCPARWRRDTGGGRHALRIDQKLCHNRLAVPRRGRGPSPAGHRGAGERGVLGPARPSGLGTAGGVIPGRLQQQRLRPRHCAWTAAASPANQAVRALPHMCV